METGAWMGHRKPHWNEATDWGWEKRKLVKDETASGKDWMDLGKGDCARGNWAAGRLTKAAEKETKKGIDLGVKPEASL